MLNFKHTLLLAACLGFAACNNTSETPPTSPVPDVTIYAAGTILTMDPDNPSAEAVAVKGDAIVAVGALEELQKTHKGAPIDKTFKGKTLVPGLIDPHVHMTLGSMMYGLDFIPPWDMQTPKGTVQGLPDKNSLLAKIAEFETVAVDGPLILYGYHNLVQGEINRGDLDRITTTRPLFIWHYSGHDFYLNSAAIEMAKLTPDLAEKFHGVDLDADGELTGRIYEDAGLALFAAIGPILLNPAHIEKGFNGYEALFQQAGVTTVAEMGYGIFGRFLEDNNIRKHYGEDDPYRLFLVPEHRAFTKEFGEAAPDKVLEMAADTSLRAPVLPQIKLFTDAAFYSQTMRLKDPGYVGGQSKGTSGLWVTGPDALEGTMAPYWNQGIDIHIHSNGDAAQDATLDAFAAVKGDPKDGQRLIIEHGGLITPEQLSRADELGIGISVASHYVYYMGKNYEDAIGERVKYITPLRSAMDAGIPTTVHSDAPLAPPVPMRAASVHMTRATKEGGISTPSERLTKEQALQAITINAAWSLGLDDTIGSIETGKLADFTVLGANPMDTAPENWPGIPVWGVVLGGEKHPVQE